MRRKNGIYLQQTVGEIGTSQYTLIRAHDGYRYKKSQHRTSEMFRVYSRRRHRRLIPETGKGRSSPLSFSCMYGQHVLGDTCRGSFWPLDLFWPFIRLVRSCILWGMEVAFACDEELAIYSIVYFICLHWVGSCKGEVTFAIPSVNIRCLPDWHCTRLGGTTAKRVRQIPPIGSISFTPQNCIGISPVWTDLVQHESNQIESSTITYSTKVVAFAYAISTKYR